MSCGFPSLFTFSLLHLFTPFRLFTFLPFHLFTFLRYRVVATASPRIAAQHTPYSKSQTFKRSMLLQRLPGIFRACRGKSARRRGQRGDASLIENHRQKQQPHHSMRQHPDYAFHSRPILSASRCIRLTTLFSTSDVGQSLSSSHIKARATPISPCSPSLSYSMPLFSLYASRSCRFTLLRFTARLKHLLGTLNSTLTAGQLPPQFQPSYTQA